MEKIGQININFDTFSNEPKYLSVMDLSEWTYSEDKPSYIYITTPGSKKPKIYPFKKFKINTFNSHNLGLSCLSGDCTEEVYVDLPDGIFTISLKSGYEGIETTKYYLKTDRFEVEMAKVLIKYGIDNIEQSFINYITRMKYILEVAKANAMYGDFVKANRNFQEAKKMLRKYVECKDCL